MCFYKPDLLAPIGLCHRTLNDAFKRHKQTEKLSNFLKSIESTQKHCFSLDLNACRLQ